MHLLTLVFVAFLLVRFSASHRILFVAPSYGGSHTVFHKRIADAIVLGGHEVLSLEPQFVVDPYEFEGPTLAKRLIVPNLVNASEDGTTVIEEHSERSLFSKEDSVIATQELILAYSEGLPKMCEQLILREAVMDELRKWNFDAYVYEPLSMCGAGIGHLLGIRTQIMVTSQPPFENAASFMGIPWPTSHVPAASFPDFGEQMSYWQRAVNMFIVQVFAKHSWRDQEYTQIFRRHFGANFPDIAEIARETSLLFVMSNELVDVPRPYLANIVHIGGIGLARHNGNNSEIEEPFNSEMEKGKDGIVLISFGTHVPTRSMPAEFKRNLLETIKAVPNCHFLWKVDKTDVDSMTKMTEQVPNVLITNWLPQAKILAHSRLRLFLSHAGHNSLMESAFNGVPIVAMPFMADQFRNAHLAVRNGWGIRVNKQTLFDGHQALTDAIVEIISNQKYAKNAKRTMRLIQAQPLSPEERLHKYLNLLLVAGEGDLLELKSEARKMSILTYYNMDILLPALFIAQFVLFLFTKLLMCLFKRN